MKSEKQKKPVRLLHTNLAHWKAKVAVTLAVVVSAVNITPAAMLGTPSHREKAIKVTFQSGDNGYFAGISDEDLKSTKSNATKSNADRTEWVQTFSDLEEDDQGYFTNLKLGAEEVEAKNQKPVWETVKNQANENNSDADDLHFAGWYSYDSKYPVKVGNYKEIYGNTTLKAEWYAPNQIKGKAKDKYKMIAVGLEERKLIASEVNKEQDIAELMEWAGEALLKEKLQADGEKVFAMELEIEEDKKAEQKKAITLTLSVQKEQLEFTKQVSVIHERENGKIEIIPADIVKSDNGDDYWVTFTTNSQGAFYFINTCNYRRTAFLSQARANTDTSGTIGKDITWKIENKTLTISGKGEMPDWKFATTPWYGSRENIEEVIIGKGITRIGEYAFYLFSNMTKVQIPEGVTSIGSYAFAYNTNLTDIMIPESIKDIDSTVFDNCGKLPDSVIIGKGSLGESDSIKWKITKKGDLTIGGTGPMPDLYSFEAPWNPHTAYKINSVIIEEGVTKIGDYLFYMCDQLTSVKIAETVLQIGESAFAGCTKLTDIIIPESVISIERFAFSNTGITSVTIPKAVEFLGQKSFPKGTQITFSKKEEAGEALKLTGNINFVGIAQRS